MALVGARGFEPPTPTTPLWCATRLRYAPTYSHSSTTSLRSQPSVKPDAYPLVDKKEEASEDREPVPPVFPTRQEASSCHGIPAFGTPSTRCSCRSCCPPKPPISPCS